MPAPPAQPLHSGYLWRKGDGLLPFQRSWTRYPFVLSADGSLELRAASGAAVSSLSLAHSTLRAVAHAKHADCFEIVSRGGVTTRLRAPSALALLEFFDRVARAAFDGTTIDRGALAGREAALRAAASPLMTPAPARTASRAGASDVGLGVDAGRREGVGSGAGVPAAIIGAAAPRQGDTGVGVSPVGANPGGAALLFDDAADGAWDAAGRTEDSIRSSRTTELIIAGARLDIAAAEHGPAVVAASPALPHSAISPALVPSPRGGDDRARPSPLTPPTTPPASSPAPSSTAQTPAMSPKYAPSPLAAVPVPALSPGAVAVPHAAASATPESARAVSPPLVDTVTPRNDAAVSAASSRSTGAWWLSPDPLSPLVSPVSEFAPDSARLAASARDTALVADGAAAADEEFDDFVELPLMDHGGSPLAAAPSTSSPQGVASSSTVFLSSSPRTIFLSASPRAGDAAPSAAHAAALSPDSSDASRPGSLPSTLSSPEQRFLSMMDGDAAVRALISTPRCEPAPLKEDDFEFPDVPFAAVPTTPPRPTVFESSVLTVQYATSADALSPVRGDNAPESDDVAGGIDVRPVGGRSSPLVPAVAGLAFWPSPAPALRPFAHAAPRAVLLALEIALPRSPARSAASSASPSAPSSASPSRPPSPPRTPVLHAHKSALSIDEFEALVLSLDEFEELLSGDGATADSAVAVGSTDGGEVVGGADESALVPAGDTSARLSVSFSTQVAPAPPTSHARPQIAYVSPRRSPVPSLPRPRANVGATIAATVAAQRDLVAAASAWESSALLRSLAESAGAPSPARPQSLAAIALKSAAAEAEERTAVRGAALARIFACTSSPQRVARAAGPAPAGEKRAASVGHVVVNARPPRTLRAAGDKSERGKAPRKQRSGSVGAAAAMRRPESRVNVSAA